MNNDNKNNGALWEKTSKTGNQYYSGNLTIENIKYKLTMFINDKKGNEKAPDYRLIAEFETLGKKENQEGQAMSEKPTEEDFKSKTEKTFGSNVLDTSLDESDLPF